MTNLSDSIPVPKLKRLPISPQPPLAQENDASGLLVESGVPSVLGIDPGTEKSALIRINSEGVPLDRSILRNLELLENLEMLYNLPEPAPTLAIEMVASYGMAVGKDTFETVRWIGIFQHAYGIENTMLVYRKDIKLWLCGSYRAKNTHVRQALIDKFGGDLKAIGNKKCPHCKGKGWFGAGRPTCEQCLGKKWLHPPGPLAGIASHEWSALAVALYGQHLLKGGKV